MPTAENSGYHEQHKVQYSQASQNNFPIPQVYIPITWLSAPFSLVDWRGIVPQQHSGGHCPVGSNGGGRV